MWCLTVLVMTLRAQLTLTLTSAIRQADRSSDYLGVLQNANGTHALLRFLEAASGPILVAYTPSSCHYFALYRVPATASQLCPITVFSPKPEPLYRSHSLGVGYKHSISLARETTRFA